MKPATIHRRLRALEAQIPNCHDVELGYCTFHKGVRIWVRLKNGMHEPDRLVPDHQRWVRWPHGLSLGAGDTVRQAFRSAEQHLPYLIGWIERGGDASWRDSSTPSVDLG